MVVAWTKNFENHIDWEGPEGETLRTLIVAVMAAEWPIRSVTEQFGLMVRTMLLFSDKWTRPTVIG